MIGIDTHLAEIRLRHKTEQEPKLCRDKMMLRLNILYLARYHSGRIMNARIPHSNGQKAYRKPNKHTPMPSIDARGTREESIMHEDE